MDPFVSCILLRFKSLWLIFSIFCGFAYFVFVCLNGSFVCLQVPYTTTVKLKRPIGLHVVEGPGKTVFVQSVKADLSAARSRRVVVGDQIVAMSASWGDRMWEVNSVESFVVVR